ncbi:MAG: VWA domain-containing protein [Gammaproteobacteria bacterium]|nr:VWA domain-containing protein [Gammaproteobacteria bacterium]MBU1482745.1 VWA domain-containing protein [Gammaproteobacteria bacterium]
MELIRDFLFLRPAWLLALPLLWGMTLWLARRRNGEGGWAQLIDAELLASLRLDGGGKRGRSPWPWLALAWTLAVLALAGPSWQQAPSLAYRGSSAWMLVLDLSPSMTAADLTPNRVTRARYALDDLLNGAQDARVGLVAFSDEPYTVTPLTDDVATIRAMLPALAPDIMPSAGDNLAPALQQAGTLLRQGGGKNAQVVVLTDGFSDPAAAFAAAKKLQTQDITVSVVGIGTSSGAPLSAAGGGFVQNAKGQLNLARLDTERLQQLAASGGGRYAEIAQLPGLIGYLQASADRSSRATENKDIRVAHRLDGGVWLLPLLLLAAALLARRGWL